MSDNTIRLNFSGEEFEQLLKLVHLGEWMANAHKEGNGTIDFEDAEQIIYATAFDHGFDDMVEYNKEIDGFVPSVEFENEMQPYIDEYDEKTFAEEVIAVNIQKELEAEYGDNIDSV